MMEPQTDRLIFIALVVSSSEALSDGEERVLTWTCAKPGHKLRFGMKDRRSTKPSMLPNEGILLRSPHPVGPQNPPPEQFLSLVQVTFGLLEHTSTDSQPTLSQGGAGMTWEFRAPKVASGVPGGVAGGGSST